MRRLGYHILMVFGGEMFSPEGFVRPFLPAVGGQIFGLLVWGLAGHTRQRRAHHSQPQPVAHTGRSAVISILHKGGWRG